MTALNQDTRRAAQQITLLSGVSAYETDLAENARKRFRIIVPCHDSAGWDIPGIEAGEEKELSVPQRND